MGLLEEITIKRRAPSLHTHTHALHSETARRGFRMRRVLLRALTTRCVCAAAAAAPSRHDGYFVDLFVRKSNAVAIGMYEKARAHERERASERTHTSAHRSLTFARARADAAPWVRQFGYTVYRQVLNYYSGEEDAYGARPPRKQHTQSALHGNAHVHATHAHARTHACAWRVACMRVMRWQCACAALTRLRACACSSVSRRRGRHAESDAARRAAQVRRAAQAPRAAVGAGARLMRCAAQGRRARARVRVTTAGIARQ
jgi:hypothetical protein